MFDPTFNHSSCEDFGSLYQERILTPNYVIDSYGVRGDDLIVRNSLFVERSLLREIPSQISLLSFDFPSSVTFVGRPFVQGLGSFSIVIS